MKPSFMLKNGHLCFSFCSGLLQVLTLTWKKLKSKELKRYTMGYSRTKKLPIFCLFYLLIILLVLVPCCLTTTPMIIKTIQWDRSRSVNLKFLQILLVKSIVGIIPLQILSKTSKKNDKLKRARFREKLDV